MTVVNHDTGEIVETIEADLARRLTTEARTEFDSAADHFARGWAKVEEAVKGGGHLALGYRSAGDYLHAEFDGVLGSLDVPARRIAVKTMTSWGLSVRAIAPVVGVSKDTVHRDTLAPVSDETPEPVADTEADEHQNRPAAAAGARGLTPAAVVSAAAEPEGGFVDQHAADPVADEGQPVAAPARPPVIGIDGKTYSTPTQSPRRRPLPDAFRDLLWDLTKKSESLHRLSTDDRWTQNAEKLAAVKNRNELLRIKDLLQQVIDALPETEVTP